MMRIQVFIQQKKADSLYTAAMDEYLKRLRAYAAVSVTYLKSEKQMEKAAAKSRKKFFVTSGKKTMASPELAEKIEDFSVRGESSIDFFIGEEPGERMETFRISSFTMNSFLTATVLLEQIYRAYRIIHHQAYHK